MLQSMINMKYGPLFSFMFLLLVTSAFAQNTDLVKTEGIKTSLQTNNIGRIFFTEKSIQTPLLSETDFLRSYTLTNKSNLFVVAYFDNSLTNYLHRLLPGLSSDSLNKIGNYQFALFVDGKEIYRSNLLPGAPYARVQDTATNLNRALIDNSKGSGSWSESFWNRFLANGGDLALTDGKHLLRMEIRSYIKRDSIETGSLIAAGELPLQVLRKPKIDVSNIQLNKIVPYAGFDISTENYDTVKIKELKGAIEEAVFKRINGVVVIKNGKLLIEEYFNGEDRNSLHDPRSVGKSFASTMMGMAIRDGYIKSESQTLKDFYNLSSFENYSAEKEQTRLKDLLTMSSGFDGDDNNYQSPGNEELMYPTSDWVKFTLDLRFMKNKTGNWHYFTAGVVLLGDILNKKVPGGLDQYAHEKLFKPLGIKNYKWQYTPQNVPNTAGGIRMNALDFAKYGQLYKNKGTWNQRQILPKEWVEKTFTKHLPIPNRTNEFYGFLFWNKTFVVGNKNCEAFYCAGNGGNYILVFNDQPLVIVITASAYGQPYAHPQVHKMLTEYILPAVIR